MKNNSPTLSLCMIVRDEALNLPRSLAPVRTSFDEIVVVDTGSTDGTPGLARSYGAKVLNIDWPDDFAAARNASLRAAAGDWIMWLDADNYIAPVHVEQLRRFLDDDRRSILWCTEVVASTGERLVQKRVFPRRPEICFTGRVHEQLVHPPDYRSVFTPVEILHWGYSDQAAARSKGERNLTLLEKMLREQGPHFYLCYQMGRTLFNLRRFDQALVWLKKATAFEQNESRNQGLYLHAHLLQAQTLDRLDRPPEAEHVLQSLIGKAPDYGPGHWACGRLKYARGEYRSAAKHLQEFLDLGVHDPISGLNSSRMSFLAAMLLGKCWEKLSDLDKARQAYKTAARIDGENPEPSLALARLSWLKGRTAEARELLSQCLALRPNHRRARDLLNEMQNHARPPA